MIFLCTLSTLKTLLNQTYDVHEEDRYKCYEQGEDKLCSRRGHVMFKERTCFVQGERMLCSRRAHVSIERIYSVPGEDMYL